MRILTCSIERQELCGFFTGFLLGSCFFCNRNHEDRFIKSADSVHRLIESTVSVVFLFVEDEQIILCVSDREVADIRNTGKIQETIDPHTIEFDSSRCIMTAAQ